MKRISALILITTLLFISTFSIIGCNNDDFKVIKSITFTTNGEKKTLYSSKDPLFEMENDVYISSYEFNSAPDNRKIYEPYYALKSHYNVNDAIKEAKNATHYEVHEKELSGTWYITYSWTNGLGNVYYKKATYKHTYFNFVYVKVKNDTTLVINCGILTRS